MRVSELGICTAPLAFVQFASGLQMTLGWWCLFCVNVLRGCYRCCCFFFLRGSWTPFLCLLAIWRLCGELGQISCPPHPPPKRPINFTRPDTYPHGCTGRLGQMKTACIFLYLHRTKNTGKVSQLTCFFFFCFRKNKLLDTTSWGRYVIRHIILM